MKTHLKLIAVSAIAALTLPAVAEVKNPAFLGVGTSPVHPTLAAQLELAEKTGLAVGKVFEGGPADKAGIREHDILAAFDGTVLSTPDQLRELVMTRKPGDEVEITVIRQAKEEFITVTLGELPKDIPGKPAPGPGGLDGGFDRPGLGFGGGPADVEKLFEDMMKRIDPDGVRGFPGFPDFPKGAFPGGGGAMASSHSSVSMDDGTHKIEMETRDGISTVKAYDSDGKLLYGGPYNTEEEKKLVPEEVRKKLDGIRTEVRGIPGIRRPGAPGKPEPPVPTKKRTI